MSRRTRVTAFLALAVACVAGIAVAVASGVSGGSDAGAPSANARSVLTDGEREGRTLVLFRALKPDQPAGEGQLAVATAGAPAARTLEAMHCDRTYFAAGHGICVARGSGFAEGYRARLFDARFNVGAEIPVDGVPSRARVSPDGRYGTVTMFVTGHSYTDPGAFSTQTTLIDLSSGKAITDLERFTVMHGERRMTAIDVNFWGVTFSPTDSDRFYATLATAGKTYLIEGSVSGRTARVIHENVECPSLSPDGTRIAYKRRSASGSHPWRLTVLDLATMRETPLAETRSIDDQAEWLDDSRVLYGEGGDVWVIPADGSGEPARYLADADSPAIVQP